MGEVVGIAALAPFCHMTAAFLRSGLAHPRQVLLLAIHILARNWGREEDFRYRAWRSSAEAVAP